MRLLQAFQAFLLIFALQQGAPAISAPLAGETLSGQVVITGTVDAPNFASAELAFAFASDPTGTWFRLEAFTQPVQESALAAWDTTQISDGEYSLRLRVYSQDGSFQDFTVTGLMVRNAAVPATATPTLAPMLEPTVALPTATEPPIVVVTVGDEPQSTATPVPVSPSGPTPQPLPANPAAISVEEINFYLIRGALLALALVVVIGIFLRLRRN
ncbi:MAG: hypothetical protein HY869_05090 [Chloroflexi bacterium]|nr:hypothetical protein [Chloroflexota bacterium]